MRAAAATHDADAIVTSLGIARNTVREAVHLLESGGLVRREMHHSATVIQPTDDELTELYQARLRLETAAAAIPATPQRLEPIQAAYRQIANQLTFFLKVLSVEDKEQEDPPPS